MNTIRISLITVTYNAESTIQRCIDSIINQTFNHIEYIVIDGNSSDRTKLIIKDNEKYISIFKSEPDLGIYDAMNKGLKLATGDIVGMLNADDYFANNGVLFNIAETFCRSGADILYADLDYVDQEGKVMRKWRSGKFRHRNFNWGWMPPHPTFYVRRECFNKYGIYNPVFGTAADYELMLRFMYNTSVRVVYLNKVTVKMAAGGISNSNYRSRVSAWACDFRAMQRHSLFFPALSLLLKPLRKIFQFYI